MRYKRILVVSSVMVLWSSIAFAQQAQPWSGHWQGRLEYRGDVWPVKLDIEADKARLGLPELWMADEPLAMEKTSDGIVIELPFGFDKMPVHACGENLCGESEPVAGHKMQMLLSHADKNPGNEKAASFKSGNAIIQGTLLLPSGEGPHPVVVLVHGSGGNTRSQWSYRGPARQFLGNGVAVLMYDKRGFGASDGPWKNASYPDLAELGQDLASAIEWLSKQKEVDARHIGVFGGSQATWTTAIASQHLNKISFAILTGAPAVTPQEQEHQRVHTMFEHPSWTEEKRNLAYRHLDLYFAAVHDPEKEAEVFAASLKAENTDWGSDVPTAKTSDDFYWWRRNADFSPEAIVRRWNFPVLVMYGANDQVVPSALNLPLWQQYLKGKTFESEVFPGGDHRIELRGGTDANGQWKFPRMAIGMEARIHQFLCARVLSNALHSTICKR